MHLDLTHPLVYFPDNFLHYGVPNSSTARIKFISIFKGQKRLFTGAQEVLRRKAVQNTDGTMMIGFGSIAGDYNMTQALLYRTTKVDKATYLSI